MVGVFQEEDKYTALSSLTADKEDGSQYTSLIKTPIQTMQRGDQQESDAPLDETQRSAQEEVKEENSEEIEECNYM